MEENQFLLSSSGGSQGSGGSDPVAEIANAVGDIFQFFSSKSQEKIAYQEWLNNSIPQFKWYSDPGSSRNSYMILFAIIMFVLVVVLLITFFMK